MFRKLSEKLRTLSGSNDNIVRNGKLIEDDMAMQQLLKMFDNGIFLPLTRWSISPREVLHICNEIVINKRRNIVEFGAGFSTICIARLLKITRSTAKFYTVENDAGWCAELQTILELHSLSEFVTIIYAPITAVPTQYAHDTQEKWYDVNTLETGLSNVSDIDLVIVDGPFTRLSPFIRSSALPYLKDKLSVNFAVFLDDTYREPEVSIAAGWAKEFGLKPFTNGRYSYMTKEANFISEPFGLKVFSFR